MVHIFSLEKIAKGDTLEQARVLYSIAPSKFATLSAQQGEVIESIDDLPSLVKAVKDKSSKFNFGKLFRMIPISARDIRKAGQSVKVI